MECGRNGLMRKLMALLCCSPVIWTIRIFTVKLYVHLCFMWM